MRAAIEAGLENAPIGVVTTPGTKKSQIRPSRAPAAPASLLAARCGARLKERASPILAALCCYCFVWGEGIAMTGRVKWSRASSRERMHRQGVEFKGRTFIGDQPPKARHRISKAELRQQAEAAFLAWRAGQTAKDK